MCVRVYVCVCVCVRMCVHVCVCVWYVKRSHLALDMATTHKHCTVPREAQRYIPCARSEHANASWYVQRVHKKTALCNFLVHALHYAVFLHAARTTH